MFCTGGQEVAESAACAALACGVSDQKPSEGGKEFNFSKGFAP